VDTAQFAVFICVCNLNLVLMEELLELNPVCGAAIGEVSICELEKIF
jgi:hypothetical protein